MNRQIWIHQVKLPYLKSHRDYKVLIRNNAFPVEKRFFQTAGTIAKYTCKIAKLLSCFTLCCGFFFVKCCIGPTKQFFSMKTFFASIERKSPFISSLRGELPFTDHCLMVMCCIEKEPLFTSKKNLVNILGEHHFLVA